MPRDTDCTITFTREYDGAVYTLSTTDANSRIVSRRFIWMENYPRRLQLKIFNDYSDNPELDILNDDFAGWDKPATSRIKLGDAITFKTYWFLDTTNLREIFYGRIIGIEISEPGIVVIDAVDDLYPYTLVHDKIVSFTNYVCNEDKEYVLGDAVKEIRGVTYSDIVEPFESVKIARNDARLSISDSSTLKTPVNLGASGGHVIYQPFVAGGDGLIGIKYLFSSDDSGSPADLGTITIDILPDLRDFDQPSVDTVVASSVYSLTTKTNTNVEVKASFISSGKVPFIARGERYWVRFTYDGDVSTVTIRTCAVGTSDIPCYYDYAGGTWSRVDDENLDIDIDFAVFEELSPDDYTFSESDDKIYVWSDVDPFTTTETPDIWDSFYRARISCYYGTSTLYNRVKDIVEYRKYATFSGYATKSVYPLKAIKNNGRSLHELLLELCEFCETEGDWNGHRHVISSYKSSGSSYIRLSQRYELIDQAEYTFVHPSVKSSSSEYDRIINIDLKQKTRNRPRQLTVVGKDNIPFTTREWIDDDDDMNIAILRKFSSHDIIQRSDLSSFTDIADTALTVFDSFERSLVEGTIELEGNWHWLMNSQYTGGGGSPDPAEFAGSGRIIRLKYPSAGVSNEMLKVKGIELTDTTTIVYISNYDRITENNLKRTIKRVDSIYADMIPSGAENTQYYSFDLDSNVTVLYAELRLSAGTVLPYHQRKALTFYNEIREPYKVVYRAVFDRNNGHSDASIDYIYLYEDRLGGSATATLNVAALGYKIYKRKGQKLIIDIRMEPAP